MVGPGIQDNPSYEHLRWQLLGFRVLLFLVWLASLFGICSRKKIQGIRTQLKEMQKMFDALVKTPDEFNAVFARRGWIAYERMNVEVMKECISLAHTDKVAEAENRLIAFYDEEQIGLQIMWAKNHPALMERWEQMQQALDEYTAERYYSCVPLLLIIIDGAVNDVDKNHGFSSEGSDISAWDSIAGHGSGLAEIKKIYTKTRKKTNTESISLPYRNGILHGRDLNYGNRAVAAKCWGILFATADWAFARQSEERRKADLEAEQNPPSFRQTLADMDERRRQMAKFQRAQDAWAPRTVVPAKDVPVSGTSEEYGENTPERALVEFLEFWQHANYGCMAQMTTQSWEDNVNKRAGLYRNVFADKTLRAFRILSIEDQASAISRMGISLDISLDGEARIIERTFDLIYQREDYSPLPRGHEEGRWWVVEHFSDIECL